jgi:hypothetical protein
VIQDRTLVRVPHRRDDPRISVEVWDDAYDLPVRVFFRDMGADAPVVGVEIGGAQHPDTPLTLTQIGHVFRQLPLYQEYAKAEMRVWDMETLAPSERARLLDVLNQIGSTRRGKPGSFYRIVGDEYAALVRAGDPAPINSIAANHGVNKSTASRWVKEAKRQGHI